MQGLRPLFLLRIRLAPKQTSASRLRRRNSLRASGLHHSKKNQENRLARSLSLQTFKTYKAYLSAEGSGPPMLKSVFKVFLGGQPVFMVWGDSLFSRFSFVSAPRFDAGESAIVGAEGLSPWRWHKGVFLVLVLKLKCTGFIGCDDIFWYTILNILIIRIRNQADMDKCYFGSLLLLSHPKRLVSSVV